jgi:hypothetical protein
MLQCHINLFSVFLFAQFFSIAHLVGSSGLHVQSRPASLCNRAALARDLKLSLTESYSQLEVVSKDSQATSFPSGTRRTTGGRPKVQSDCILGKNFLSVRESQRPTMINLCLL